MIMRATTKDVRLAIASKDPISVCSQIADASVSPKDNATETRVVYISADPRYSEFHLYLQTRAKTRAEEKMVIARDTKHSFAIGAWRPNT